MALGIAERLQAEHEIVALKHSYLRACDGKDVEIFRSSFVAAGGRLDYGPLGKTDPDAMADIFRQIALAEHPDGGPVVLDMHHAFMPSIEVSEPDDGERPSHATGTWTQKFRQIDRVAGTEYLATGVYHDTYVVEGGRWVMSECVFEVQWSVRRPLGEGAEIHVGPALRGRG